jgi:hypothetical protein
MTFGGKGLDDLKRLHNNKIERLQWLYRETG